jgi:hypothetical protein
MAKSLRHIASLWIILCSIFALEGAMRPLAAQWQIMERPEDDWGVVQTFTEMRFINRENRIVLVGTSSGLYLDRWSVSPADASTRTNKNRWLDIGAGIPLSARDVYVLISTDSTVFALTAGGVYYTTLFYEQLLTESAAKQILWKPLGVGLRARSYSTMLLHEDHSFGRMLAVGSESGVWAVRLNRGTTYKQAAWNKLGGQDDIASPVDALFGFGSHLYAGTRGGQLMHYSLDCDNCFWDEVASRAALRDAPVRSVITLQQPVLMIPSRVRPTVQVPCSGLVTAVGGSKLLLGVGQAGEGAGLEWIDISPSLVNKNFNTAILSIVSGDFPDAPHSLLVGTAQRGVLFSDDCGMSWYELNDAAQGQYTLHNAEVRSVRASDGMVLAGVRNDEVKPLKGGSVAALAPKTVAKAAQIAETTRRTADTTRSRDSRLSIVTDVTSERGLVQLQMSDTQPVEVAAYNILGKKVMDIYNGEARNGSNSIPFDLATLSRGMYICVVRGKNFKLAEKFLVVR